MPKSDPAEQKLYERLRRSPFPSPRRPTAEQLAAIRRGADANVHKPAGRRRFGGTAAAVVMAGLLLLTAVVFAGSQFDSFSPAAAIRDITSLDKLGKTPEEALRKFRGSVSGEVVYKQTMADGVALFLRRPEGPEYGSNLQLEYIRKTWLGWKWGWGGSYGIGGPSRQFEPLTAMGLPALDAGFRTPFPMLFGEVLDSAVKSIVVTTGEGEAAAKYRAVIVQTLNGGAPIWYVNFPAAASGPYRIDVYDRSDNLLASGSAGSLTDTIAVKRVDASLTDPGRWKLSPIFQSGSYDLQGIPGRLGALAGPLLVDVGQKVMWHFWGGEEELTGDLLVTGTSGKTGWSGTLFTGRMSGHAPHNGADATMPSSIKLTDNGLWRLDVYIDRVRFGSIFVKGKTSFDEE